MESNLIQIINQMNCDIGSSFWVDVTHINNPHSFFVRPIECRDHIMSHLNARGPILEAKEAQIGTIVVYKSILKQEFIRGQIRFVNYKETCDIFALDNGFFEQSIPFENVYEPLNDVNLPPLAVHCHLAFCTPLGKTWDKEAIDAMKFFLGEDTARIDIVSRNATHLIVELHGQGSPPDLGMILALSDYTWLGDPRSMNRKPKKPKQYKFKKLKVNYVYHVRFQSGKSLEGFYVAMVDDYKQFITDRNELTDYYLTPKTYDSDIKKGQMVAVRTETLYKFERGLVKEITKPDLRAEVQLVDWGGTVEAPFREIRPEIPEMYLKKPVIAIYCKIHKSQIGDSGLLQVLCPGFEFLITIKEVGDGFKSPNIVRISFIKN